MLGTQDQQIDSDYDSDEVKIEDDSAEESVEIDEYSISIYGADYDVEGILRRFSRGDIVIPEFQRRYVWTKPQASRFVESLLLGLPVPGIFLYREAESRKMTVLDGQQRIQTLHDFCREVSDDERPYKLSGLETRYNEYTYHDLADEDRRKLDDSIIHTTIIRQEKPEGDSSSKYAIFERLNTGGTNLASQEIRSAIFPGTFCELITELNMNKSWRILFGKPHKRKRDEELILRFFALFNHVDNYHRPMARFLNEYMQQNQDLDETKQDELRILFSSTVDTVLNRIGDKSFKPQSAVNAAVLDSVMVGVATRLDRGDILCSLKSQHEELLNNSEFIESVSGSTSDTENVLKRIKLGIDAFAEAE